MMSVSAKLAIARRANTICTAIRRGDVRSAGRRSRGWRRRGFPGYFGTRGGIKAYLQTVGLVMFRPARLAHETRRRVPAGAAKRFHQESMALATIIGTGLMVFCFLLRGTHLEEWLSPSMETLFATVTDGNPLLSLPLRVWTDRLFFVIPLGLALYLALHTFAWSYRKLFFYSGAGSSLARRRAERIAYYASGLCAVLVLLGGLFVISWMLISDEWAWAMGPWRVMLRVFMGLLAGSMVAVAYYPTLVLLARAGRPRVLLNILLSLIFLGVQALAGCVIVGGVFWVCGYVSIAVWAMVR